MFPFAHVHSKLCLRAKRGFGSRGNIKNDMSGRTWIWEGVIVRSESETGVTGDSRSRAAYAQAVEKSNSTVIR